MSRPKQPATRNRSATENSIDWFKSSDADVSECHEWDIKPHLLQEAVLGLLARGYGISFGLGWDKDNITITVFKDEGKKRVRVTDSIEWDDTLAMIISKMPKLEGQENPQKLRAVGP